MKKLIGKIRSCFKRMDVRLYYGLSALALSLSLTFWRYPTCLKRLAGAFRDVGSSLAYWFLFSFTDGEKTVTATVNEIPAVDVQPFLPFDLAEVERKCRELGKSLITFQEFGNYNGALLLFIYRFCLIASLLLPLCCVAFLLFRQYLLTDMGKPAGYLSKPYRAYLAVVRHIFKPCSNAVKSFVKCFLDYKWLGVLLALVWIVNLNVATLAAEAFAYYCFFVSGFNILTIPKQLVKLVIDLILMLSGAPLILWGIAGAICYYRFMQKKAVKELNHMEARNCGFIKDLEYTTIVVGVPGIGKTSFITSMALSTVNIFKKDSRDTLFDCEMQFPGFSFAAFRQDLDVLIEDHLIYNIPSAALVADAFEEAWRSGEDLFLYGYDFYLFPIKIDVGNRLVSLFDVLRDYAKAYFIYMNENPSISNYPIRFDGSFDRSSYFRLWNGSFFGKKPAEALEASRYSHIFDQDIMRMGKRILPENPYNGSFGFGIYTNTEWAKSRGNQLTLADVSASDEECNQKNDLYSYSLKMQRHANTMVAFKVYFRFFGDEQRAPSLTADQLQLCSVLSLVDQSEVMLALPGFAWLDWLYGKLYVPFVNFYEKTINKRGDTCLPIGVMKSAVGALSRMYSRMYNRYGFRQISCLRQKGTAYGSSGDAKEEAIDCTWFQLYGKDYADRYRSDCYAQFFAKEQLNCAAGINDYPTYDGLDMTPEEMQKQHDYFIMQLMRIMSGEKAPPKWAKKKDNEAPLNYINYFK